MSLSQWNRSSARLGLDDLVIERADHAGFQDDHGLAASAVRHAYHRRSGPAVASSRSTLVAPPTHPSQAGMREINKTNDAKQRAAPRIAHFAHSRLVSDEWEERRAWSVKMLRRGLIAGDEHAEQQKRPTVVVLEAGVVGSLDYKIIEAEPGRRSLPMAQGQQVQLFRR